MHKLLWIWHKWMQHIHSLQFNVWSKFASFIINHLSWIDHYPSPGCHCRHWPHLQACECHRWRKWLHHLAAASQEDQHLPRSWWEQSTGTTTHQNITFRVNGSSLCHLVTCKLRSDLITPALCVHGRQCQGLASLSPAQVCTGPGHSGTVPWKETKKIFIIMTPLADKQGHRNTEPWDIENKACKMLYRQI